MKNWNFFERKVTKQNLIRFLDMANYLNAYLINNNGKDIKMKQSINFSHVVFDI
jgi:hypothetical protein